MAKKMIFFFSSFSVSSQYINDKNDSTKRVRSATRPKKKKTRAERMIKRTKWYAM